MFDKPPSNASELHGMLNTEFYEKYDVDYFYNKTIFLAGVLASPQEYLDVLSRGFEIGKIKIGKMPSTDTKWITNYAKQEIVINSYHSIESFFRLLFAHVERSDCPWLGVLDLRDFNSFKKRIDSLLNRKYFKANHDEVLSSMLLGSREAYTTLSDEDWSKNVKNMLDLLDRAGHDLLSTPDYNVFKHGAALFNTEMGFNFADVIKADKQDSFMFLSSTTKKEEKKIIKKYFKTYKFMKWEIRFATTVLVTRLMTNLLELEALRLGLKEGANVQSFHQYDLHKMLETGIIPATISEGLFEQHIQRKKKK